MKAVRPAYALADAPVWRDEHVTDHRRRVQTAMLVSLALHGVLAALFAVSPPAPEIAPREFVYCSVSTAL